MEEDPIYRDYHNYLMLVGDIATHYAAFENRIDETIWLAAALDDRRGACITSQIISIRTKFRVLIALMHELSAPETLVKEAKALSEGATKCSHYRNKYIHSPMSLAIVDGKLSPIRTHITIETKLEYETVPYDMEEMQKTSVRCQELKNGAFHLADHIRKHILSRK